MRHGCTGTMSKRKSNHHSGCQIRHHNQKKHGKCVHTSRWCWRYFLILRVLFTMSFYQKAGQSIRSIIWKLCNVFVRQWGKKDMMRGGRIDGYSNMTMRPHIHRSFSVTSWPNTQQLSFHSLRTLQISHQLTSFCFQSSNQRWKAAVLSLLRRSRQIQLRICAAFLKQLSRNASEHWRNAGSDAYRVEGSTLKATRLNSFKVRLENFYAYIREFSGQTSYITHDNSDNSPGHKFWVYDRQNFVLWHLTLKIFFTYKNVYQFIYTQQQAPDNSKVDSSLQNWGPRYAMCFMSRF